MVVERQAFGGEGFEQVGAGAGQKGLAPEGGQGGVERGAAGAIEMGGDLVEQEDRGAPKSAATAWALARIRLISSAFCSPVEQERAGMAFSA